MQYKVQYNFFVYKYNKYNLWIESLDSIKSH